MIITIRAKWELCCYHNGIKILRRVVGSGTSCGRWSAVGCYYETKAHAIKGIDRHIASGNYTPDSWRAPQFKL